MTSMLCRIPVRGWDLAIPQRRVGNPQFDVKSRGQECPRHTGSSSFGLQEFADYLFYVSVLAVNGVV
jgi:hypothetical protein